MEGDVFVFRLAGADVGGPLHIALAALVEDDVGLAESGQAIGVEVDLALDVDAFGLGPGQALQ